MKLLRSNKFIITLKTEKVLPVWDKKLLDVHDTSFQSHANFLQLVRNCQQCEIRAMFVVIYRLFRETENEKDNKTNERRIL